MTLKASTIFAPNNVAMIHYVLDIPMHIICQAGCDLAIKVYCNCTYKELTGVAFKKEVLVAKLALPKYQILYQNVIA